MRLIPLLALCAVQAALPPVDPATLGPAVGGTIPRFEAADQRGKVRDLAALMGPNGLVLVFFRSADW